MANLIINDNSFSAITTDPDVKDNNMLFLNSFNSLEYNGGSIPENKKVPALYTPFSYDLNSTFRSDGNFLRNFGYDGFGKTPTVTYNSAFPASQQKIYYTRLTNSGTNDLFFVIGSFHNTGWSSVIGAINNPENYLLKGVVPFYGGLIVFEPISASASTMAIQINSEAWNNDFWMAGYLIGEKV